MNNVDKGNKIVSGAIIPAEWSWWVRRGEAHARPGDGGEEELCEKGSMEGVI